MTTPAPLTPADCDLRDFAFMPLDVGRLRDSDLATQAEAEEFRCAVLLWCASWHQLPAASLPDDDKTLAQFAGYGRVVKEWLRVKEGSMRGWIMCDDGRFYHPVVAEKARDAWRAKLQKRWMSECARVKKHNQRHGTDHVVPDFDDWLSLGSPQGHALIVPRDTDQLSPGTPPACPDSVPRETPSKREGEGQGQGEGQSLNTTTSDEVVRAFPPQAAQSPPPQPDGSDTPEGGPKLPPCPHRAVLDLWREVLPAMPQHNPDLWDGTRADHLRARWRETAQLKGWATQAEGLTYLRKLFAYVAQSQFLTGKSPSRDQDRPAFVIELEWLVKPSNWRKVIEGKYHPQEITS